ncbi:MAG: hypothetical protein ACI9MC_000710 [Kiritimatiellia bacterium]|jgi:hypothetical protein
MRVGWIALPLIAACGTISSPDSEMVHAPEISQPAESSSTLQVVFGAQGEAELEPCG